MNQTKKEKLKKLLLSLSPDEERVGSLNNSQNKIVGIMKSIEDMESENKEVLSSLNSRLDKQSRGYVASLESLVEKFSEEIRGLRGDVVNSRDTNGPPLFKDMINSLSDITKHTKRTADRTESWKFPQYSSVSVRNKNFSNINPATDGLGIGDYDYVSLSNYSGSNPQTIVFKTGGSSGTTNATLTLTYDGSGNLTSVTKV